MAIEFNRRTMLQASAFGAGASMFGRSAFSGESANTGTAKSTILFFLCGGASQIDTWDMKPDAPLEYRGPFQSISTAAPELQLSEHLPLLAQQAKHLSVIRSVDGTVNTNDHHAGYYYNLTGHVPDVTFRTLANNRTPQKTDWPFMGSVVASRSPVAQLPNAISLPHSPSRKPYTRPGQFSARLGVEFDPLYLQGVRDKPTQFTAPALKLQTGITPTRLNKRHELLAAIETARRDIDRTADIETWTDQQQRAMQLLTSSKTATAFNLDQESPETRARYGDTINGMSLLLARRLAEAGVPFITVFWLGDGIGSPLAKKCRSAGSWDTHGNNFGCLKDSLLPEFDRCYSALISDLHERNMLDETLVMVTSEMGRKPKIGDPRSGGSGGGGRDHWTYCLSDLMAGGGIRGGQAFGSTDPLGEYPADNPVTPADVTHTVYHAMGITDLEAVDDQGRPYNLLPEGRPIVDLF